MGLTQMDIHHKEFRNARFGGYNEEDVDSFLDMVSDEISKIFEKNQELERQLEGMKARLGDFEEMEGSLQSTLITAAKSAGMVKKEAEVEASAIIDNAKEEAERILSSAMRDREDWEKFVSQMKSVKQEYLGSLRKMAESLLSQVREYSSEDEGVKGEVSSEEEPSGKRDAAPEEVEDKKDIIDEVPGPTPSPVEQAERLEERVGEGVEIEEHESMQVLEVSAETIAKDNSHMSDEEIYPQHVKTVVIKKNRDKEILVSDERKEKSSPADSLVEEVLGAVDGYMSEPTREQRQERLLRETKAQVKEEAEGERQVGNSGDSFWE